MARHARCTLGSRPVFKHNSPRGFAPLARSRGEAGNSASMLAACVAAFACKRRCALQARGAKQGDACILIIHDKLAGTR